MPKKRNRLREVLYEKGLKQAQAADLCGVNRERFRKILGNRVEILGWELMKMAEVLEVEERELYEPDEIDVWTYEKSLEDTLQEDELLETVWSASLVAANEESLLWLRGGLLQKEHLVEGPGFAQIKLKEGRILLGRAVERIGASIEEKKAGRVVANQILSIVRKEHEEDRKLSRFQLDLSFSSSRNLLTAYVQSSAVKIGQPGARQVVAAGECVFLEDQDHIFLPNEKILRVEFSKK